MAAETISQKLADLAPAVPELARYDIAALLSSMTDPIVGDLKIANDPAMLLWLEFAERNAWQPIRILQQDSHQRSRGLPERKLDIEKMCDWCGAYCNAGWVVENRSISHADAADHGVTFWFEKPADAIEFSLKWGVFKCT